MQEVGGPQLVPSLEEFVDHLEPLGGISWMCLFQPTASRRKVLLLLLLLQADQLSNKEASSLLHHLNEQCICCEDNGEKKATFP